MLGGGGEGDGRGGGFMEEFHKKDFTISENWHQSEAPLPTWHPLAPSRHSQTLPSPPRELWELRALSSHHSAGCRLMDTAVRLRLITAAAMQPVKLPAPGVVGWVPQLHPRDTEQPLRRAPGSWASRAGAPAIVPCQEPQGHPGQHLSSPRALPLTIA